jgi:regulatory protein
VAVVSALRATRGGRVAVHVDGEYLCTVGEALLARWRLHKGRELDPEAVAALRREASAEGVVTDAHRLLAHRARSREELRRRLLAKGHTEEAVAGALERLEADGLLDDAAFARSYVADKRNLGGWGAQRIARGLAALGVAPEVAEAALTESSAPDAAASDADAAPGERPDGELERALAQLRRKGPPKPPLETAQRRAYQALLRRGYAPEVAYAAVRRWLAAD